jgi:hypothetical protein
MASSQRRASYSIFCENLWSFRGGDFGSWNISIANGKNQIRTLPELEPTCGADSLFAYLSHKRMVTPPPNAAMPPDLE